MDDRTRRRRERDLRRQSVASFVVGALGVMLYIATSSKVVLVLTMVVLVCLPLVSRLRSVRGPRSK